MEYNPNIFSLYEKTESAETKENAGAMSAKELKEYGKFERKNLEIGNTERHSALAVFLVASVLEIKNRRILNEARGVDDVVKVSPFSLPCIDVIISVSVCISLELFFPDPG